MYRILKESALKYLRNGSKGILMPPTTSLSVTSLKLETTREPELCAGNLVCCTMVMACSLVPMVISQAFIACSMKSVLQVIKAWEISLGMRL